MNAQDTRSIVVAVYADLLRRAVDPEGLQKWSAHLEEGNEPDSLAAALVDSVEFRTLRIVDAYVAVLGDEPDSRTVAELVEALDAGVVDIDSLRLHVLEEVVRAERVRTDAHFVAVLYDVSLGRALPVREADFWVRQIRVQGRGEVARAVWFSDEAMRRRVRHLYLQLLHRSADDVALQTWVPVMSHHGDAAVRSGLIGSAEYRESALRRFGTHAPGLQGLR